MGTYSAKPQDIRQDWFIVDATDKVLGRMAAQIAHRLRGKHKTIFTPHMDTGDYFTKLQAKHPERILEKAVKGMLPKGPLGYAMIKKLKVYAGAEHPHAAQQPQALEI
jgi:large subunit ribosomal protein L13